MFHIMCTFCCFIYVGCIDCYWIQYCMAYCLVPVAMAPLLYKAKKPTTQFRMRQ